MCGRYFVVLAVMTSFLFLGPRHMAVEQQTSVQKKAEKSFSVPPAQLSPEEKKALKEKTKQAKRQLDKLKKLQKQKARELRKKRRRKGKKRRKH